MRFRLPLLLLAVCCTIVCFVTLGVPSVAAQIVSHTGESQTSAKGGQSPLEKFLTDFDLPTAVRDADGRLRHNPHDTAALFVRMETAELEERPDLVLDSALRLCSLPADAALQELASNRILQHAGNIRVFNSITRRLKAAAALNNSCTFNLRLALVAAAMEGQPLTDLDQAVRSAGLLTRWRIVGPFGSYNNVDFERRWPAEMDLLSRQQYGASDEAKTKKKASADSSLITVESFWFHDGMLSLPEYFPSRGIFYAAGEFELTNAQPPQLGFLTPGIYALFMDGKQVLLHDSRYAPGPSRNSALLRLRPGHHRILVKFTADAAPLSVALHPQFASGNRKAV